ncbi:MAG: hypothetical protein U0514_00510 [Candidatus Andersenbacteria bacterium]
MLTTSVASAAEWKIVDIEAQPDRIVSGTRFGMAWELALTCNGVRQGTVSTTTLELEPLLAYLRVDKPQFLVGESWESDRTDAFNAFDLERIVALHHGNYRPPDAAELLEHAATAIAQMRVPQFDSYDELSILAIFGEVFRTEDTKDAWVADLAELVRDKSDNAVQVMQLSEEAAGSLFQDWAFASNATNLLVWRDAGPNSVQVGGVSVSGTAIPFQALYVRPEPEPVPRQVPATVPATVSLNTI